MSGISASAGVSGAGVGGSQNPEPSFFEHLLNDIPLATLDEAAKKMDKVLFFHGGHQAQRTFEYEQVRECLRECVVWARSDLQAPGQDPPPPHDAKVALQNAMGSTEMGMEGMAALRAWTCSPICYAFNSVMRSPGRSRDSVKPVLAYGKLLFTSLHALPARFLFQGTLFRGETGVMPTWQDKKERLDRKEDVRHFFYVLTSFSVKKERAADFKAAAVPTGADRTFFTLNGAAGYYLKEFSSYAYEEEVLVEPVCCCAVLSMEIPQEQYPGENLRGLHTMELRVRPGISLLCVDCSDGPAKQAEKKCYEAWLLSQRGKLDKNHKLYYAPFNKEEWESKGYAMPRRPTDKGMAMLGRGGDMTAYRMKNDAGEMFAVKIVKLDTMTQEDVNRTRKHVEREAHTLERLNYKYVIRYHGMYEDEDDQGFCEVGVVMELAQGGSLAQLIKAREERGQNVGMPELLDMSIQIAKALDYVHGEGILHRDVKAENVLLASAEGGPVCIKLADFGVAAVLTHTAGTKRRSKVGTDEYLSPEQARSEAYGSKADMWALGCILVELASCRRLQGSLWADTVEVNDRRNKYFIQVHERGPVLGDIAKSLLDRDATARLSASELRVCLDKLKTRLEQDEKAGEEARVRARALQEAEDARVARALQVEEEERMSAAARALQEAEDALVARALQAEEEERMSASAEEKQREEEEKAAKAAAAAEGERRAAAEAKVAAAEAKVADAEAKVATVGSAGIFECQSSGHSDCVFSVAWSPDGTKVASGSRDNTVKIWETSTGTCVSTLSGHSDWVRSVVWSPTGSTIASASNDRTIKLWNTTTGECDSTLSGHSHCVSSVAWSPNSTILASGSWDSTVKLWNTNTGDCVSTLSGHYGSVYSVCFSPDGKHVASGSGDKTVKIWETSTGTCLSTLSGHSDRVISVAWSSSGSTIASGSADNTIKIWNAQTGQCVSTLSGHSDWVWSVTWSPDGKSLASASDDKTVRIWDASTGQCVSTLSGHSDWVRSVAFGPDGTVASGSKDQTIKIWNTNTGQCVSNLPGHSGEVNAVTLSPDAKSLASGSDDKTVKIWGSSLDK